MNVRPIMNAGLVLTVMLASAPAGTAQDRPASAPLPPLKGQASPPPSPAPDATLPPYEPQLDRLSELMGALAYLRDLCGKGDGAEWRGHMSALLDAEATTASRRERLAGAYNRGFRGYEATYKACTPSAQLVIARYLEEGDRLTRELSTRFGGG